MIKNGVSSFPAPFDSTQELIELTITSGFRQAIESHEASSFAKVSGESFDGGAKKKQVRSSTTTPQPTFVEELTVCSLSRFARMQSKDGTYRVKIGKQACHKCGKSKEDVKNEGGKLSKCG